jgi:four helix bundle protein
LDEWKDGRLEEWMGEMTYDQRRNVNRGYRKLVVWQDAIDFYAQTSREFQGFPFELGRVASQQIASADSIHRNIAEGYCRRSRKEYLQFLNYALSSAGESVSGLHAYRKAEQISKEAFDQLDGLAYKLENGLMRLIESLQDKDFSGDWSDSFAVKETNRIYGETDGECEEAAGNGESERQITIEPNA